MYRGSWLAVLVIAFWMGSTASAQSVLLSNLPAANDIWGHALGGGNQGALRFTLPGTSYAAGTVRMRFSDYDFPGDLPILELRDYTGDNLVPGTNVLLTFNSPPPAGPPVLDYVFTPSTSFTLQANTSYWFVLRGSDPTVGSFFWRGAVPPQAPGGPAAFGSYSNSITSGANWVNEPDFKSIEFLATAVPEPTMMGLFGLAALGGGGVWWQRRRTQMAEEPRSE